MGFFVCFLIFWGLFGVISLLKMRVRVWEVVRYWYRVFRRRLVLMSVVFTFNLVMFSYRFINLLRFFMKRVVISFEVRFWVCRKLVTLFE